jgi:hypothetical protein
MGSIKTCSKSGLMSYEIVTIGKQLWMVNFISCEEFISRIIMHYVLLCQAIGGKIGRDVIFKLLLPVKQVAG